MSVSVQWDVDPRPLSDEAVTELVEAALARGGRAGLEVGVVFVGDSALAALHERFLGDPRPTDVLAFDLGPEGGGPEAEVYCSVERAQAVARERGVPAERELALYVVHGVLHLCGLDDAEPGERARMRVLEAELLDGLGYVPDRGETW